MAKITTAGAERKPFEETFESQLELAHNGDPDNVRAALDWLGNQLETDDFLYLLADDGLRYPPPEKLTPPEGYPYSPVFTAKELGCVSKKEFKQFCEAQAAARLAERQRKWPREIKSMRDDNRRAVAVASILKKTGMDLEQWRQYEDTKHKKRKAFNMPDNVMKFPKVAKPVQTNAKPATAKQAEPERGNANAEALRTMKFEPIKYVIDGIIVEGLTLLAGKPKIGKSWLLLHAAIAVAKGGYTLGHFLKPGTGAKCSEGDVLYCALEDNLRRLQSRMEKLQPMSSWPKRLTFWTELPRFGEGGLTLIWNWIQQADNPRLVIIDTLAMVKEPAKRNQTTYDADYDSVVDLRKMAAQYNIAIVIVHHLRKAEADDAFDTVSGTLGLTGAPDSILVLKRDGSGAVLHGRGRDLMEIEKALTFHSDSCRWQIIGDAQEVKRSGEQEKILNAISAAGEPIGANEIAAETGMRQHNVRFLLQKLARAGEIERVSRGKYRLKEVERTPRRVTPGTRAPEHQHRTSVMGNQHRLE